MKSKRKEIAPQLMYGSRERIYQRLPSYVKIALKAIARDENKSLNWVLEEVIIRFFGFRRPVYKVRKVKK